jgi:uncharacterized repeat protein (TIGR01451 family)
MARRHVIALFAVVLGLSLSIDVAAGGANLAGSLEAYRVVVTDQGVERFLPAESARPSDVIEYRLVYRNTGDEPIQHILITDPIPIGTALVHPSATHPENGRVEYSIDGGENFQPWPILVKKTGESGEEALVEATPDMVTHIRWSLTKSVQPDGGVTLTYRAVIK